MAAFAASVRHLDVCYGRVLNALAKNGLSGNTFTIFKARIKELQPSRAYAQHAQENV